MGPLGMPEAAKFFLWMLVEIYVVIKLFRIIERD
jgi:hypothetical protein